jgi:hypothetical protein
LRAIDGEGDGSRHRIPCGSGGSRV